MPSIGTSSITGIVQPANGGTGINNGSNTITLGGNVSTAGSLTTVGAYGITLTAGATTSLALPASGTVVATATVSPAQGDILYYNGSAWTDLVHGTNGQYLQTQGASANPQWATVTVGTGSLTGVVQVANGGTGDTTLAAGSLLLGNGTGAVATLADGATGSVLISGGSGSNPSYSSSPTISGANITSLNGSNIASGTVSASYLPSFGSAAAGIVPASGGGTTNFLRADGSWAAVSSLAGGTASYVPLWSSSSALTSSNIYQNGSNYIGIGTATLSQMLTVNGNIDAMGSYNGYITEIPNGLTATVVNKLAKMFGANTVTIGTTGDTDGMIGIVVGGAGTSGNAQIAINGQALCAFDSAPTGIGDFVTISSSTAGASTTAARRSAAV